MRILAPGDVNDSGVAETGQFSMLLVSIYSELLKIRQEILGMDNRLCPYTFMWIIAGVLKKRHAKLLYLLFLQTRIRPLSCRPIAENPTRSVQQN